LAWIGPPAANRRLSQRSDSVVSLLSALPLARALASNRLSAP